MGKFFIYLKIYYLGTEINSNDELHILALAT